MAADRPDSKGTENAAKITCSITDGGIAATHAAPAPLEVLAAPATASEFNTVRLPLRAEGCWRLEDVRFEFDSSFITPSAAEEFKHLAQLCEEHPGAPLSIFGHADPVGDDAYNKQLSGRRASAVYAMLIRKTEIWEELYSNPLGGDDWGTKVVQVILLDLGYQPGAVDGKKSPDTREAVKQFQTDNGLAPGGDANKSTRAKLFLAYMDRHCRNPKGEQFKLTTKDFLAQGADSGGKGDYQGCGEFNPLMIFSKEEAAEYSKPENKGRRDAENACNRRVLVFLFRPGTRVTPSKWPCPRVKEGAAACQPRFWSDAAKRRSNQEKHRVFDKDGDTFACRFYQHRFASNSPCEIVSRVFMVRLLDPLARPIPFAPYRIVAEGTTISGRGDGQGWAFGKAESVPDDAEVQWGYPVRREDGTVNTDAEPKYAHKAKVFITIEDRDEARAAEQRLNNLGYFRGKTLKDKIRAFQCAYDMPQTGRLEDVKADLWRYHDTGSPDPLPEGDSGIEE